MTHALRTCYCYALVCTIIFVQLANSACAQERAITGIVKTASNEALPAASVKLVNDQSTILRFAITDERGAYTLSIPQSASPLWLEVSYIGYKKQRIAVTSNQSTYTFILPPDANTLSEVTIKKRPITELYGDTLRYYVMSFANKEDRSIRDVLRRMPGIEVADDGTIYHNGKKVENLYIQGDDLMDGRYGLATKVIRKEMILSVDVIRNHQPIQVLKDKIIPDKTSINLVLKSENSLKMSANLTVGAGLPKQYDVSFTPILLNKTIKMINTVAVNNSGIDYSTDFKQLGSANLVSNISNEQAAISLSLGTIGPPDLPLANYYFNRSGVINLNNIYNTKKGLQFKLNLQGFIDKNSLSYFSRVENYLANDTVSYREMQSYTNKPALLNTSFNIMANKPRYFFNNNIRIKLSKETNSSFMDFNDYSFGQSVNRTINEFSNDLNWIPAFKGRGIGEVRWLISYTDNDQLLDIGNGYYFEIRDQQGYYDHVLQRLNTPTLFSNAYFGYKIPGEKFRQEYRAGVIVESQTLTSNLNLIKGQQQIAYSGDVGNDLKWDRKNIYVSTEYELKLKKLRSTVQLPVMYQDIHFSQNEYNLNSKNGQLIFNPSINFRYDINVEQYLSARYKFSNSFGNITGVYRGAVLHNYRTLQANNAGLQEKSTHSSGIYYSYQKAINMLFVNAGASYDNILARTVVSTEIDDNIQKIIFLPYRNTQSNLSFNAGYSQYFFGLKSTISLKSQVSRFKFAQFINNELLPFNSDAFSLNGKLIKKIFEKISLTYQPNALWTTTKLKNEKGNHTNLTHEAFRLDQQLLLGINAINKLYWEVAARHSYSKQSNNNDVKYFFADTRLRYTNAKKRLDLSLAVTNLFNVKDYTLYSILANQLLIDQYNIRGRMAIVRADFYF